MTAVRSDRTCATISLTWLSIGSGVCTIIEIMANRKKADDIDYRAEGEAPPHEKEDPTNKGYDEAAHSGPGRYGVAEGSGGVFGTTGGGTYSEGMHVEERPAVDLGEDEEKK
jgi:hypothetical protein